MKKVRNVAIITAILVIMLLINTKSFAKTVIITTDGLYLRREASTTSDILDIIYQNMEVELIEEQENWYKVKYNEMQGYINKDYAKIKGEEEPSNNPQTSQEEPSNNIQTNQEGPNNNEQNNNGQNNIIDEPDNPPIIPANTSKEMKLQADAQGYILPLINSNIMCELKKGDSVTAISFVNGWAYVETSSVSVWVRTDKLTDKEATNNDEDKPNNEEDKPNNDENVQQPQDNKIAVTPMENTIMYVQEPSIYVRKGPATTYDVLDSLILNSTVIVNGKVDDWYQVQIGEDTGYIASWLLGESAKETTSRGNIERNIEEQNSEGETNAENQSLENTSIGNEIVSFAKDYLNCPYVYGGSGPNTFDCSGFTMYVYKHFGVSLSHSATAQSKRGTYVAKEDLQPGDLVFFKDYETMEGIGHCGIYIGEGEFIHASSGTGYCVKISTLLSGSYDRRYETARRIL